MENAERLAMTTLLNWLKPACSLEIGTREGGSLGVIAEHSGHVFTLDIDPGCQAAVRPHSNVELVVGDSHETLPGVLKEIGERQLSLEFVLVDGEHSAEGVRGDIERLLEYRPTRPCYILMHDSFNPFCRDGMATAPWERSPYVHRVDLDFIPGKIYHPDENGWGTPNGHEMWCGLGLAVLRPEERVGPLTVLASGSSPGRGRGPGTPIPEALARAGLAPGRGHRPRSRRAAPRRRVRPPTPLRLTPPSQAAVIPTKPGPRPVRLLTADGAPITIQ
jgi:hypothetical protein